MLYGSVPCGGYDDTTDGRGSRDAATLREVGKVGDRATAGRLYHSHMTTHSFSLILSGDVEPHLDALYEAGCDDASFGAVDGVWHADFDREAPTLEAAIESAVSDVRRAGVEVAYVS